MITQDRLKELLSYNPETGIFIWLKLSGRRANIGDVAGSREKDLGYVKMGIDGILYRAHRLAWFYVYGVWPKNQIDHINHIRHDNRISNLREATLQENFKNLTMRATNTSGVTGVWWNKKGCNWVAEISLNYKKTHLGSHIDKFEAICARKSAERNLGFHKNHGA